MLKLSKGVNLTELIREAIADQKRPKYGHCLKGIDVNIIPKCFGDIFSDVCVCVCVFVCPPVPRTAWTGDFWSKSISLKCQN